MSKKRADPVIRLRANPELGWAYRRIRTVLATVFKRAQIAFFWRFFPNGNGHTDTRMDGQTLV